MNAPNIVFLFLDFDGVLHRFFPLAGLSDAENSHLFFRPAFEDAVRACRRPVKIVITSTWRNKYSLDELRGMFSEDISELIVGVTPKTNTGNTPGSRRKDVVAWLEEHHQDGAEWVGIDDMPELYDEGDAVVCCHDQFVKREHDLLIEAVDDPKTYAVKYPCPRSDGKLRIMTGIKI